MNIPNLGNVKEIAIDTETYDPRLLEYGPGWGRDDGYMVGFSVATQGWSKYFPISHVVDAEKNLPKSKAFVWLERLLEQVDTIVGANLLYDFGWLAHEGIKFDLDNKTLFDVQYAEAILSPGSDVGLDYLGQFYLNKGKHSKLYEDLSMIFGGKADGSQRKNIWRASPALIKKYAEVDAELPLEIKQKQVPLLKLNELDKICGLECDLIPLYLRMRMKGVKVNLKHAEWMFHKLTGKIDRRQKMIPNINVDAGATIKPLFDELGLKYSLTDNGNPSFAEDVLKKYKHPKIKAILEIRKMRKLRDTFIRNYILESHVNGIIYAQFHPLLIRGKGAHTGRYSSSSPNLQNIPRDKDMRRCFIPDSKSHLWHKMDYSQIEYRLFLHSAVGPQAEDTRNYFQSNPDTDYHQYVIDMIRKKTGIVLERVPAKAINFGIIYGMGLDTLSDTIGVKQTKGNEILQAYYKAVPFARQTLSVYKNWAKSNGEVRTIANRRVIVLGQEHKGLNNYIQGSAADLFKIALHKMYYEGVLEELGHPLRLVVHDEFDMSIEDVPEMQAAIDEAKHIMETCVKLRVPVKIDAGSGRNWGAIE